jgi:hypothetical protein
MPSGGVTSFFSVSTRRLVTLTDFFKNKQQKNENGKYGGTQNMADITEYVSGKNFLKPEDSLNGKQGIIVGIPELVTSEAFGKKRDQLVMNVKLDDKESRMGVNQLSAKNLANAWGTDTTKWQNKKFSIGIMNTMISGQLKKMFFLSPV